MRWEGQLDKSSGTMVFQLNNLITYSVDLKSFGEFNAIHTYIQEEVERRMARHINTVEVMLTEMKK